MHKPNPGHVIHAVESIGADLGQTILVGDDPQDIKTAASVGIPCLALSSGYTPKEKLLSYHPAGVVRTFSEIPDYLIKLKDSSTY